MILLAQIHSSKYTDSRKAKTGVAKNVALCHQHHTCVAANQRNSINRPHDYSTHLVCYGTFQETRIRRTSFLKEWIFQAAGMGSSPQSDVKEELHKSSKLFEHLPNLALSVNLILDLR